MSLPGQNQIRAKVGQRLQDKSSFVDPRMRQLQFCALELRIAQIEKIDIDPARSVAGMIERPTKVLLDLPHLFQQIERFAFEIELKDRV